MQHGLAREGFPDTGELRSETPYRNNSRHGKDQKWYKDSQVLQAEIEFEGGIVGLSRSGECNGRLISELQIGAEDPLYQILEVLRLKPS